jgi:hypothetical protein
MARYDDECKYNATSTSPESLKAMGSKLAFLKAYLSSGREFCQLYHFWKLPLYYLFGLTYTLLKVLLLNPPFLVRFQSSFRWEVDAKFPGETPAERLAFAKRWYGMEPRQAPFIDVGTRLTHLADSDIWMEQFTMGLPEVLSVPAMTGNAIFEESTGAWRFVSTSFTPHLICGWVRNGEKPDGTGWYVAGEFKHWWGLGWFYKWMVISQSIETYGAEMVKLQENSQQTNESTALLV